MSRDSEVTSYAGEQLSVTVCPEVNPLGLLAVQLKIGVFGGWLITSSTSVIPILAIVAVQFPFGQPASWAVAVGVGTVAGPMLGKVTLPFLIEEPGTISLAGVTETGTLFCPGAVVPPLLVQVKVAKPDPLRASPRSAFPRPAILPPLQVTLSVCVPTVLKVHAGAEPCKKCGLPAHAAVADSSAAASTVARTTGFVIETSLLRQIWLTKR
jgi:hypothetical protein